MTERKNGGNLKNVDQLPGATDHAWNWQRLAACRGMDSTVFYSPDGERQPQRGNREARAKQVCRGCPVINKCREFALETREPFGVWGGLSEGERKVILDTRKRPGA